MEKLISEIMMFMTEQYGMHLKQRMGKLKEEVAELEEALNRYQNDEMAVDDVLDEAADVLLVLLHIVWLVMPVTCRLFGDVLGMIMTRARIKMELREKDKDYARSHPHVRNVEGGE